MCGKTTTTNQQSSSQPPWQVLQEYQNLTGGTGAFPGANAIAGTPYAPYTGEMVAPVNQQQQTGIGTINTAPGMAAQAAVPLNPTQISNYYNPYQEAVIQATQNQFQQNNAIQDQQIRGSAIVQGALGGDREGVAEAIAAGQQQLTEAPVIAGLEQQGYNQALGTAAQQYQTNPEAAAYEVAGLGQAQVAGGTLQQQTQQAQDTAAQTAYWQQQGYPFQVAAWLANIAVGTGSALGGTSQSTTTQPAPFFGLSDERAKEDISKVGQTKDGQPLYRYRFKGDPEWHIGLLAQDVEKKHPEAVADIGGGYKGVDVKGATDSAVGKGYQTGGSPMGPVGVGGVPFGPLDPGLLGSGGLGQTLGVNSQVRGAGPPKPPSKLPPKPQTAMDMFKQASDMANMGSSIGTGAQKVGNWLSSNAASAAGAKLSPEAATQDIMSAAEGTDVPLAAMDTIGPGVGAAADVGAGAAADVGIGAAADAGAAGAADLLPLLLLAQSGGRINYPGGLALPSRNRIQLPMRGGLGMPSFVPQRRGYQEGGAPTVTGAGDPEQLYEQARQNQLTASAFAPTPDTADEGTALYNDTSQPMWKRVGLSGPPTAAQTMAYSPDTGGGGGLGAPAPSGGYQPAPRLATRPQLAGGQGEGFLGMSPDFWYSALAGLASALASPSPFAGVAIGQGLLGGLGAYSGLKKGEANIEMEAQKLDQAAKSEQDKLAMENRAYTDIPAAKQQELDIQRRGLQLKEMQPFTMLGPDGQLHSVRKLPNGTYQDIFTQKILGAPDQGGTPQPQGNAPAEGVPTSQAPGAKVAALGGDVPSTRQMVASGQPFNYSAGAPVVSKGMDVPEPQDVAGRSAASLKNDAEYYAVTGKLPPIARGNSPVAMQTNAYRTAVQNYGAALSQSRGVDPQTQAMMWREAPLYGRFIMGADGRATVSLGTAVRHLDLLKQLATAWDASDVQTLNRVKAAISTEFGSNAATNLQAASSIVGPEIVKAIGVAGAGTDNERRAAAAFASPVASPDQMLGAVNTVQGLLGGQLEGKMRQAKAAGLTDDQFKNLIGDRPFEILSHAGGQGKAPAITGRDKQALDWANAHPDDPQAKQIKQHLGVP